MKVIEAIKKIYPTIQGGFVYWKTQYNGSPLANPIDGLVWENTEFAKPTWSQIEAQLSIADLEEAKSSKLAQITPARDAFMYADIEYNGSTFTNSKVSGSNLDSEILDQTPLIEWLDVSGNQVDLTLAEAKELKQLIKTKRRIGYFQEAALITQINAIVADGEYFDNQEPPQPITPVQAVNAINITF